MWEEIRFPEGITIEDMYVLPDIFVKAHEIVYLEKCLYTYPAPPIDLLIRTSGEQRLSNYMLYQASYAELYFPKTFWPAFNKKELYKALEEYSKRQRRFGKV